MLGETQRLYEDVEDRKESGLGHNALIPTLGWLKTKEKFINLPSPNLSSVPNMPRHIPIF